MLGFEVPLFDRGDGEAFAAESRGRRISAERRLAQDRLVADARAAGLKIVPRCPFVAAQRAKHPDWAEAFAD
jgi:predicted GNAT family acetyltransferase